MVSRRKFLRQASAVGAAFGAQSLFGTPLFAQTKGATDPVRIYIDSRRMIAPLDRNLFGSFPLISEEPIQNPAKTMPPQRNQSVENFGTA